MKKIILLTGTLLIILNVIALLVFCNYNLVNFLLVSFSIITTSALIYFSNTSKNIAAYRIGLTYIYSIIGIAMICLSLLSFPTFKNNIIIIILFGIAIIEVIILSIIQYMRKHV